MGWFRSDRVTWGERALWTAFVAGTVAPVALKPGAEKVALAYVEAVNSGDVEAALDRTTTDVVIRPSLGGYYYRREAVREVLEYRAALAEHWRVITWAYDPAAHEVHALVEVTNDAWTLLEHRPVIEVVLVVRAGLLVEQIRNESKDGRRALQPFLDWAARERPRELALVWRNDRPIRRADSARRLVALLREWRAAVKPLAGVTERGQA